MPVARETLLEFPCVFPLKVIGRNVAEFEGEVLAIIQKHVPEAQRENVTRRPSAGNKYLALTVTFVADNQRQLDELYFELNRHELVLMTL
jgi:putative lipoic acid-binding regulatory protein